MKKILLLSLLILLSISAMSQEKGLYLSISGGLGPTGYKYNIQGVNKFAAPKCELKLGGQVGLGVSYYFTKHFGISTGIGLSHYRTYAKLLGGFEKYNYERNPNDPNDDGDKYAFHLGNYIDNDPFDGHTRDYNLRVRTQNWVEYQSGKFLEIPLLLNLQKKFGDKEIFGLYLGLGAKFQIPIRSDYEIKDEVKGTDAALNVYGYYPEKNLYLGKYDDQSLAQHGFGVIENPSEVLTNAKGKLDHKFNIALVAEGGFLISLSRRVDLALGAFIDYGLMNLKRKTENKDLFKGPGPEYTSGAEKYNVAKGIEYNSITQTDLVKRLSTLSYGGKIGVRIKLGKLSQKDEKEKQYIPQQKDNDPVLNEISDKIQALDSMMKEVLDALKNKPQPVEKQEEQKVGQPNQFNQPEYYYLDDDINILFEPIYFDLNKSVIKPEGITILTQKVTVLNKYPDLRLLILGNTCDIGQDYYNFELGAKRAEAAKRFLLDKGIAPERLEISTQSKYLPELPNTSENNRTHNRRDDFRPLFPKRVSVPK